MIVLTVLSYNGAPTDGLSASFDELGGTIGRADNNQLVLPDPERTISRVHARVVFRTSGYTIVDNGSNPISVNGTPLGTGREQPLRAGDQVQIGGYVLQASERAASASADPFADLFGDSAVGLAVPPPAPAPMRSVMHTWPAPASGPAAAWPPAASPAPSWPAPAPALAPGQIPDDWDPFANDAPAPLAAPAPVARAAPDAPLIDLPMNPMGGDSLDDLFGLAGASPAGDPLGAAPQQALLMQPNTAAHADPLQSLGKPAAIVGASHADVGSELNTPMPLPPVALATPAPAPAPASPSLPAGAVFSWDEPSRDARVVTMPGVRRAEPEPLPPPQQQPPRAPAPLPRQPAPTAPAASDDALLAALLEGLGTPGLRIDQLTPELMLLLGQLLRESTRGAVELLVARAALKREMRAEMTMIVARENNPLKFSPSVEVALQHLLGTQSPGFMAPAPAVRDAFDDLRAHQLGVMAGMKAAFEGVLQRFDPQQLEGKLTRKSAINSLIPATRKARLWELFQELFGQISSEAQDDFDELFGRAFLRAYEAQLDRLHGEPGAR
jgi:type VI secretion system FHA domain protein